MCRERCKKAKRIIMLLLSICMFMYSTTLSYASQDDIKILEKFDQYFETNNMINYILRSIGWSITQGLLWVTNTCETLLNLAYNTLNFTQDSDVNDFITTSMPIVYSLFALALLFFAYQKIINPEFGGQFFTNFIITTLVITALSTAMIYANDIITTGRNYLVTNTTNNDSGSTADVLVASSITDLEVLEAYGWNKTRMKNDRKKYTLKNNLSKLPYVDMVEMPDGNNDKNVFTGNDLQEEIWDYKLRAEGSGDLTTQEIIDAGVDISILHPRYFRYSCDFISTWVSLIALIIVFLLSTYKVLRIIFELTMQKILAPFFAVGDIANGKKIRQVLSGILSGYAVLLVITLLQQLYALFTIYVMDLNSSTYNPFVKSIFLFCVALAVVDGPNFIEQTLGIDAGLKSAFSMFAVARTASTIGKGAMKITSSVANTGAGMAGAVMGATNSGRGNLENHSQNTSNQTSGSQENNNRTSMNSDHSNEQKSENNNNPTTENQNIQNQSKNGNTNSFNSQESKNSTAENKNIGSQTQNVNNSSDGSQENNTNHVSDKQNQNLTREGSGNHNPYHNPYNQSANSVGERYKGGIGDFLRQNTGLGRSFSRGQDFGNAVNNSFSRSDNKPDNSKSNESKNENSKLASQNTTHVNNTNEGVGKDGKDGKDGRDGFRGRDGLQGVKGESGKDTSGQQPENRYPGVSKDNL